MWGNWTADGIEEVETWKCVKLVVTSLRRENIWFTRVRQRAARYLGLFNNN